MLRKETLTSEEEDEVEKLLSQYNLTYSDAAESSAASEILHFDREGKITIKSI